MDPSGLLNDIDSIVKTAWEKDRSFEDIRVVLDYRDREHRRLYEAQRESSERKWRLIFLVIGILTGSGATGAGFWAGTKDTVQAVQEQIQR